MVHFKAALSFLYASGDPLDKFLENWSKIIINARGPYVDQLIQISDQITHNHHVFSKGNFNSFNDHRIAMCAAILSSRCAQEVSINDITSVETSFPNFFENLANLGFTIETK